MLNSRRMETVVAAAMLWFGTAGTALAQPVEINECGQVLADGGYLAADLDCSSQSDDGPTVQLGSSGTLDLRGFTLTGYASTSDNVATVACTRGCTVEGPGTIVGSPIATNAPVVGFYAGPAAPRRIIVRNATITGGGMGVTAPRVTVDRATITNNRSTGIWSGVAKIKNATITGNGTSPSALARTGIWNWTTARVTDSVVTGNGIAGIRSGRLLLKNTWVTGNDANPLCATNVCALD